MKVKTLRRDSIIILSSYAPSLVKFRGDLIRVLVENHCNVTCMAPMGDHLGVFIKLHQMGAQTCIYPLDRTGHHILSDLKTI